MLGEYGTQPDLGYCWVKVGVASRSLAATAKNFFKPWFFIDVRRGRVSSFWFASKFVD